MSQIFARDYFSQGGIDASSSPYVLRNMGTFENLTFVATSVTLVEATIDGTNYFTITSLGTTFSGGITFKGMCFRQYRITFTGSLVVNAN